MYEEVEGEDSETARQEFKMSTLTEMLDGCGKIGVPLSPLKVKRFGKRNETDFASWPIVKAIGEWAIKRSREPDPALAAANAARDDPHHPFLKCKCLPRMGAGMFCTSAGLSSGWPPGTPM